MCKPGSARGGSSVTTSGAGLALAVLAAAGVVSMAAAFITDILTAALVTVFSIAAFGIIALTVILCRTRGVVTWPMRSPLATAGRGPAPAPVRALPARRVARPVAGAAARPAIPARQPLAIEAPAPAFARIGVPAESSGLVIVSQPAYSPEQVPAAAPGRQRGGVPEVVS
jgi:hypothetical protein